MANDNLCSVTVLSVTTLDSSLKRILEPRAASPGARLTIIEQLAERKVPTGVLVAPVIPMINDAEMETILNRCAQAGATTAAYVFLRLPLEVKDLFYEWLHNHYPARADHVISLIRQSRGGTDYQNQFGQRMRGSGVYAELIAQRFKRACTRLQLNRRGLLPLDCTAFNKTVQAGEQLSLL